MNRAILLWFIGFTSNSVLMRWSGKVDDSDIFYPTAILIFLILSLLIDVIVKRNSDER